MVNIRGNQPATASHLTGFRYELRNKDKLAEEIRLIASEELRVEVMAYVDLITNMEGVLPSNKENVAMWHVEDAVARAYEAFNQKRPWARLLPSHGSILACRLAFAQDHVNSAMAGQLAAMGCAHVLQPYTPPSAISASANVAAKISTDNVMERIAAIEKKLTDNGNQQQLSLVSFQHYREKTDARLSALELNNVPQHAAEVAPDSKDFVTDDSKKRHGTRLAATEAKKPRNKEAQNRRASTTK